MQAFTKTERFKELNISFALDEGLANPTDAVTVYYGEKSAYCECNNVQCILFQAHIESHAIVTL